MPSSIAVLPFTNLNGNTADEYFSDGVSEAIMTELAKMQELRVTSRTSSFALKGKQQDVRAIGKELDVDYLIEGSVLKAGGQVRVSASLVQTKDGFQLWTGTFDHLWDDIFALLTEIPQNIGRHLKVHFKQNEIEENLKVPTKNIEAYNLYLKGNFHYNKYAPSEIRKAIHCYEEAHRLDPDFALACTGLARCYFRQGNFGQVSSKITYPKARMAVERALTVDPTSAESHVILASLKMYDELNWESAGHSFAKALQLKSEIPIVYREYGWYLTGLKQYDRAIEVMKIALQYDPISPLLHASISVVYRYKQDYKQSIVFAQKALDLNPEFRYALECLGFTYTMMEEYEKALRVFHQYKKLVPHPLAGHVGLAFIYAAMGEREKMQTCIDAILQLKEEEPHRNISGDLISAYAASGETEKALSCCEDMFENRMGVISLLSEPVLDYLRGTSRFRKMQNQFRLIDGVSKAIAALTEEKKEYIQIQSDIKEQLQLCPRDFLLAEAQDNYVQVIWQENNLLKKKMLRLSIGRLAEQLPQTYIRRCHRSFLVNLEHPFNLYGNARGYRLSSRLFDFEVPVSRGMAEEIIPLVRQE